MEFVSNLIKAGWFVLCVLMVLLGATMVVTGLFPSTQVYVDRLVTPGIAYVRREVLRDVDSQQFGPVEAEGVYKGVEYQVQSYYSGIPNSDMAWATEFLMDDSPYWISVNGVWSGPLPPKGNRVKIDSPTGKIEDVVITDLDTGETYVSDGLLSRPESQLFVMSYYDSDTGEWLATCSAVAPSRRMAEQGMRCLGHDEIMTMHDIFDLNNGGGISTHMEDDLPR